MNINEIKEIIESVNKNNVESLSFENNGIKLEVVNNKGEKVKKKIVKKDDISKTKEMEVKENNPEINEENYEKITSPLVGVFYESPSPEDPAFVKEGQSVNKGDVLCIVEAMKVMNEIVAKNDGVIKKVLVENEEIVEHGQTLFLIE
ncbi:MAG: acetyl-CoA carboxylase biotin carboxyl carrier protein [Bacillota bacterium]